MLLKTARFVALILLALALGVSFSHLLQAGPKGALAGFFFLDIHQVLLRHYGGVVAAIEVAALLVILGALFLVRRERPAFVATLVSTIAVAAMLLVWAALLYPLNQQIATWTPVTLPPDWEQYRYRWHFWETVRAGFALLAFGAFVVSLLLERKKGLFGTPY